MMHNKRINILCLLMAAGASRRFDGIKQLATVSNTCCATSASTLNKTTESLLGHSYHVHHSSGFNQLIIVLGANAELIKGGLPQDASYIYAQHWQQGLGHSIADALKQVSDDISHVYIALADQIALTPSHVKLLVDASKHSPDKVIATQYQNKVGAPAIFPRSFFAELKNLKGDKGARDLLLTLQQDECDKLQSIAIAEAAIDIDTQGQLAAFIAHNSDRLCDQKTKVGL